MSGSREGFSVGHDISSDKKLVFNLTNQFARPLWLNASQLKGQRWKLSIALVALLVVYLFDWGFSTERAIYGQVLWSGVIVLCPSGWVMR